MDAFWSAVNWGSNKLNDGMVYISFGMWPDVEFENNDGYYWGCRTAEESNADVVFQQFLDQYEDIIEFIGMNLEWLPSGGNVDINSARFADIDGPDDDFSTLEDNNWRLTSSSPAGVIEGGKCTAPDNYKDMDRGARRTPGWTAASGCFVETGYSMGAYEYNY